MLERLAQRRDGALQTDLEAGALMRADVEDDAVGFDRARDIHGFLQRGDRFLVDLVVRTCEVDQVERMAKSAADPRLGAALLEALEVGGIVVRRPPGTRALGEDLDAI